MKFGLEIFSYKWHPIIIYTVYELDTAGYSELEASIESISSKMLSSGLSDLRERNILKMSEAVEGSGRKVYSLTEKGRALIPALQVLDAWSRRHETQQLSTMIVEDEQMVVSIIEDYFPDSYDIRSAETAQRALDTYHDDIELLIFDRRLRKMSGDELAASIRAEHKKQLMLCVSGVKPGNDIHQLQCDEYIQKPFTEDELKTKVELLLNRTELEHPAREYLSLRSKQVALNTAHGISATKMKGYQNCTEQIERLNISTERRQTLERLLYSTPSNSTP